MESTDIISMVRRDNIDAANLRSLERNLENKEFRMSLVEQVNKFLTENGPLSTTMNDGTKVRIIALEGTQVTYNPVKRGRPKKLVGTVDQFVFPAEFSVQDNQPL